LEKVLIIDYGMSNLGSIKRALEECCAEVVISDDPKNIKFANRIILPGVGAFADGIKNLRKLGFVSAIREIICNHNIPFLGICLGMQLLANKGYEGGEEEGLGLIPGAVKRLEPSDSSTRIPHIGWNEVYKTRDNPLFADIPDGTDFYFVHSYHFIVENSENIIAKTPYCGGFISAVTLGNIFGVQFHPEKSGKIGFQVLKNFLNI
jgi:imidazole glycerol-phosphate synthase subunit HisH